MDNVKTLLLQLRNSYIGELPERLNQIESLIMSLESGGRSEVLFNDLFRHVHSLKGSGGTHGLHIITAVCHPLEDYLSALPLRSNLAKIDFANISLGYLDLLREIVERLRLKNDAFFDIEDKLAQLRQRSFAPAYSALVVENSSMVINVVTKILHQYNFRIVVQDDGYATLGRALVEPFDLLITALELKQLNGVALITALQMSQGASCNAKTILLTTKTALKTNAIKPDFVILKDDKLNTRLGTVIKSVFEQLEAPAE